MTEIDLNAVYRRLGTLESKIDKCISGIGWCQFFLLVVILIVSRP